MEENHVVVGADHKRQRTRSEDLENMDTSYGPKTTVDPLFPSDMDLCNGCWKNGFEHNNLAIFELKLHWVS